MVSARARAAVSGTRTRLEPPGPGYPSPSPSLACASESRACLTNGPLPFPRSPSPTPDSQALTALCVPCPSLFRRPQVHTMHLKKGGWIPSTKTTRGILNKETRWETLAVKEHGACIALSPFDRFAAVARSDGSIHVWELEPIPVVGQVLQVPAALRG
jgi:hypothetical protein